jgi:hypothetical protein
MQRVLSTGSEPMKAVKARLFDCLVEGLATSVSEEFNGAMDGLYEGRAAGLAALGQANPDPSTGPRLSAYSKEDVRRGLLSIELDNLSRGLFRRIEESPIAAVAEITGACGAGYTLDTLRDAIGSLFSSFGGLRDFACTGLAASGAHTESGDLIHARTLDVDITETWNRAPTVMLVEETGFLQYVAAGTAGLFYNGGISGMNEAGITAAIHQMVPRNYKLRHQARNGNLGPYVQQRILREARTVDDAVRIARDAGHFASWTIVVGDAKNGEIARIEFSGEEVVVDKRGTGLAVGQANHFIADEMQDQAVQLNFSRWLDSPVRVARTEELIAKAGGAFGVAEAIDAMADHVEESVPVRSFGRTVVKPYAVLGSVAVPSRSEMWVTAGEREPATHGTYVAWKVDYSAGTLTPAETRRPTRWDATPSWRNSLAEYIKAHRAARDGDLAGAADALDRAVALAAADGIDDAAYRFVRGRVRQLLGRIDGANADYDVVLSKRAELSQYHQALATMYAAAAKDKLPGARWSEARRERELERVEAVFDALYDETDHFDLRAKQRLLKDIDRERRFIDFGAVDFLYVQ